MNIQYPSLYTILVYLAMGYRRGEIADLMQIAPKTVSSHLRRGIENYGYRTSHELLYRMTKEGLFNV